ncbi:MAG TPA: cysteine--tRNA ligase [Beijerinckiaceae bacterium]|nr:cysteine--tRNA ligase [Beijerinckiaceae bacterium]
MTGQARLKLYNTLARAKQDFVPLDPANVRMYACGPTVYDYAHIGNARPAIVFDVLFRLLRHVYGDGHVTYVRNITDVDDKINQRAFERWTRKRSLNEEIRELTRVTADQYFADVAALGTLSPTHQPRATDYVCDGAKPLDMVRLIEGLVARGHAYAAEGHVLFHVPSMPAYGRLARRSQDDMVAGARVEVAPYKRDPMDFVLWKPSNPETEPGWDSPWGFGRPGWHIECSAMSGALLGAVFDIHAGGLDLIFPHHENEIAQSCCFSGKDVMANYWLHNGFLQVEGQKMSKSLGNFITIHDLLSTDTFGGRSWPGEVLRFAMLKTHYRQPIDWTLKGLEEAEGTLRRLYEKVSGIQPGSPSDDVIAALADDLNTPSAIAELHRIADTTRLAASLRLMGFSGDPARIGVVAATVDNALRAQVEALIAARNAARAAKNFAESDRLRDELATLGVALKDGKDASGNPVTTWEVKR